MSIIWAQNLELAQKLKILKGGDNLSVKGPTKNAYTVEQEIFGVQKIFVIFANS